MNLPAPASLAATGLLLAASAFGQVTNAPLVRPEGERYLYQADALTGSHKGTRERMEMSFTWTGTNIECRSAATATNVNENAVVHVSPTGQLFSAQQQSSRYGEEYRVRVSFDKGDVLIARTEGGKESVKRKTPPPDLPVISDLALMTFMRTLPLGKRGTARIQMADYAQQFAPASVRDAGEETVTVPAGTFACHKVEVTIDTLFYRKTMTYWITKDWPHFGVKHTGIRGAFTPEYSTELVKILEPEKAP